MNIRNVLKLFKWLMTLILLSVTIFFCIRAFHNLTDESISTRYQYRFGDDNRGNMDLMAITICLGMFKDHKNASAFNLLEYNDTFPDLSWNIVNFIKLINLGGTYSFWGDEMKGFWKPILDWRFGMCHTFDPKEHEMLKVPVKSQSSLANYQSQSIMFSVSNNSS